MQPLVTYKYRSGAAALRCLSEGTAYFASPGELNDMLEAKFDLASAAQFVEIYNTTLGEIAKQRGYTVDASFAKDVPRGFPEVNERENKSFAASCQSVGIFSSAPRPNNQPMWAYYCDNFRGVCFHLEWSEELIRQYKLYPVVVTYTKAERVLNRAEDYRDVLLELAKENPRWSLAQLAASMQTERQRAKVGLKGVARAVSLKHTDWEHEGELRMLRPQAGPIPVMQQILKAVIFVRTDFPEWGSIMMLLHRLYPETRLYQMEFQHKEPFVTTQHLVPKLVPIDQ